MPALAIPVAIDVVVVAILAAILIWASTPLWRPILQAMSQIPFIGAFIAGRVEVTVVGAINAGVSWANSAVQPLGQLIYNMTWGFYFYRDATVHVAESTFNAINGIVSIKIPQLEGRAAAYTQLLVTQTQMLARLFFTQSLQYTELLVTQARMTAELLVTQARLETQLLVTQTQMLARLFFTQSLQYTELLVTQARLEAQALVGQAEGYALGLERLSVDFTRAAFAQALTYVDRQVLDLRNFLDWARRQDMDLVRGLLASQALALGLALGAVVARVVRLETSKCQQFCDPLGDLGADLADLSDLFTAGALFALAGAAARDPRGWAREVAGDLVQPLREAAGAVLGETGVNTRAA